MCLSHYSPQSASLMKFDILLRHFVDIRSVWFLSTKSAHIWTTMIFVMISETVSRNEWNADMLRAKEILFVMSTNLTGRPELNLSIRSPYLPYLHTNSVLSYLPWMKIAGLSNLVGMVHTCKIGRRTCQKVVCQVVS